MEKKEVRAEILATGLVQGVGFRYFVLQNAMKFDLKGYVKNLFSGEVYTVAEGEKFKVEELFKQIKIGPMHAQVKEASIKLDKPQNEFTKFEIRY
jgi:acylphosphatase